MGEKEIARALERANESRFEAWGPCRYGVGSDVLVLCGENPGADARGYLVFRGPQRVRLPWWMGPAEFRLARAASAGGTVPTTDDSGARGGRVILVESGGREFCVVCGSVAFYELSEEEALR